MADPSPCNIAIANAKPIGIAGVLCIYVEPNQPTRREAHSTNDKSNGVSEMATPPKMNGSPAEIN